MIEHWFIWFFGKNIAQTLGDIGVIFLIGILPFWLGFYIGRKINL